MIDWDAIEAEEEELFTTMDEPWYFTIVFDPEKAEADGWTVKELEDYTDSRINHLDLVRVNHNTWQAAHKESEFAVTGKALCFLSCCAWVMDHAKEWTVYEDDEPEGADYFETIAECPMELLEHARTKIECLG